MGVVVRRYIDILTIIINFPYSTCISSFLAAASLLLCSFLKCCFGVYNYCWGVIFFFALFSRLSLGIKCSIVFMVCCCGDILVQSHCTIAKVIKFVIYISKIMLC